MARIFVLLALSLACLPWGQGQMTKQVLFISMDGFRWDYLNQSDLPNFNRLANQGVKVTKQKSLFTTQTFPTHWSLVTGLYEDQHGIVSNRMYDPEYKQEFYKSLDSKWYNDTEPVWITVVRENLTSGVYMWIGADAVFGADRLAPSKVVSYAKDSNNEEAVDRVVDWLANETVNLACLYIDDVDVAGHRYGPNSMEVQQAVKTMDLLLGRLLDRFDALGLDEKVNIIVSADHGMAPVSSDKVINLTNYINFTADVQWSSINVVTHILPTNNSLNRVYEALKSVPNMRVYKKEEIPEALHYKMHRRIQPLVLIANEGWSIVTSTSALKESGDHGYDSNLDSMKTIFIARGPNIRCGIRKDTIDLIDIYPLLCKLLDLRTCHSSPGNPQIAEDMVTQEASCLTKWTAPLKSSGDQAALGWLLCTSYALLVVLY